jgi:hypothetical protein
LEACCVVDCACVKSSARLGLFGERRVSVAVDELSPWNWRQRSLYCERIWLRESASSGDFASRAAMPSRKDSSERAIWLSWLGLESRFRDMARWRSSRESLMWSERRKSCEGFDMAVGAALCVWQLRKAEVGVQSLVGKSNEFEQVSCDSSSPGPICAVRLFCRIVMQLSETPKLVSGPRRPASLKKVSTSLFAVHLRRPVGSLRRRRRG